MFSHEFVRKHLWAFDLGFGSVNIKIFYAFFKELRLLVLATGAIFLLCNNSFISLNLWLRLISLIIAFDLIFASTWVTAYWCLWVNLDLHWIFLNQYFGVLIRSIGSRLLLRGSLRHFFAFWLGYLCHLVVYRCLVYFCTRLFFILAKWS